MQAFSIEFDVNLTGVDFHPYFGDEGFELIGCLGSALRSIGRMFGAGDVAPDLHVRDLVAAARTHQWALPALPGQRPN
jgi:hypothetical protein